MILLHPKQYLAFMLVAHGPDSPEYKQAVREEDELNQRMDAWRASLTAEEKQSLGIETAP